MKALIAGMSVALWACSCSSVPWDSVDGLKEGENFQRIPDSSLKAAPQSYSAVEGETVTVTSSDVAEQAAIGEVLLLIRVANCISCNSIEDILRARLPVVDPNLRFLRLEVQSVSESGRFQAKVAPTLIRLSQGRELRRMLGMRSPAEVEKFIAKGPGA